MRAPITLTVDPGHLAVNQAHRCACKGGGGLKRNGSKVSAGTGPKPYRRPSAKYKAAFAEAIRQVSAQVSGPAMLGPVRLVLACHWSRKYGKDSPVHMRGLAFGDEDAPVKAVQDALAKGGAIEDDGQVVELHVRKFVAGDGGPRIIAWLTQLEDAHVGYI